MHILIDREYMNVLYKHQQQAVLANIMHIECKQTAAILSCERNQLIHALTDLELRLLYKSMCGQSFLGHSIPHLEATLVKMLEALPESDIDAFEVELQALAIPFKDDNDYKYVRGDTTPALQNFLFRSPKLETTHVAVPYIPPAVVPEYVPAPVPVAAPREPRQPRAPRDPNVPIDVPKTGSKTGRVWEIAEPIYEAATDKTNWKALRTAIVAACEAEGINSSTASVQYSKWRQTKL